MDCVAPMIISCAGVVDMDSISPRHLIFATHKNFPSGRKPLNSVHSTSICSRYPVSRFRVRAKRSSFQGIFHPSKNLIIYLIVFVVSVGANNGNDTRIPKKQDPL